MTIRNQKGDIPLLELHNFLDFMVIQPLELGGEAVQLMFRKIHFLLESLYLVVDHPARPKAHPLRQQVV
jgi:hypothetical protein